MFASICLPRSPNLNKISVSSEAIVWCRHYVFYLWIPFSPSCTVRIALQTIFGLGVYQPPVMFNMLDHNGKLLNSIKSIMLSHTGNIIVILIIEVGKTKERYIQMPIYGNIAHINLIKRKMCPSYI